MPTYLNEGGNRRERLIGRIRHTAARMRDTIRQHEEVGRDIAQRQAILRELTLAQRKLAQLKAAHGE